MSVGTGETSAEKLDALARRVRRAPGSLQDCANLTDAELDQLIAALDAAIEERRLALDQALHRFLPWPLRAPILRWLRR